MTILERIIGQPDIVGLHQVAGVSWDKIEEAALRHGNEEILAKLRTLAGR